MNDAEAAQQLQTIRTLMERAALYRRALGPILTTAGCIGLVVAAAGFFFRIESTRGFLGLWLSAGVVTIAVSLLMVRRQALRDHEVFWTPPTRRVVSAMFPALFAGALATMVSPWMRWGEFPMVAFLPCVWSVCYGLALHAAGFFTLRGIQQLGWAFVTAPIGFGFYLIAPNLLPNTDIYLLAHAQMGGLFGLCHLVAGGKLLVEERYSLT